MANGKKTSERRGSAFEPTGLPATVEAIVAEMRSLYREDNVPWIVGYSGGKDSTAVLALVWLALAGLPPDERHKTVHVISTDTLVENPVVAAWVDRSHAVMARAAAAQQLPLEAHKLTPDVQDTFWVNLIGKGYPAPRHMFRWCTERMKIRPSNRFIMELTRRSGSALLLLGARKAESQRRQISMTQHERRRTRERLSPNASLPGALVYTPIEDWTNDDVWLFLMQTPNPWGFEHRELLGLYQGASADGECPLVVDTSTPSCGDSRFGCWVCTLVEKDKSMSAMISNDEEKEWMLPLMQLRDMLDKKDDRDRRDWRRMHGGVQLMGEGASRRVIPGPYTQEWRSRWLREVLEAQTWVRAHGPEHVRAIELISLAELEEIRRLWVFEKHEIEDLLPVIYAEATGQAYPGGRLDDGRTFRAEHLRLLRDIAGEPRLYEICRDVLAVEQRHRQKRQRKPVQEEVERVLRRHEYLDEADALARLQADEAALAEMTSLREPEAGGPVVA
ncbi:MAG: DNA phosphorothioation system sulfurtransferase DndC [Verrucomicrobia bacterium]|nr:DNA phosphorothioation system sulfurtransferase DndC [Verrucomicrobiota bacterium]